jgi:hypothetical protein
MCRARSWVKEGGVAPLRWGRDTMPLQATGRGGQRRSTALGTRVHGQNGVITSMASMGEALAGQGSPRDHARWLEGYQSIFMARPRRLGCWISS